MVEQDLINKKYGDLVIKYVYKRRNKLYAHCKCICGETVEERLDNIIRGVARKSCGINGEHKKVIVGNKYGKLTLLGIYKKNKGGRNRKFGHFECDCGNSVDARLDSVIRNDGTGRKSCGCDTKHCGGRHKEDLPKINLIGNTYGRLVVTNYAGKIKDRKYWLCKCSCGSEKVVKVREDLLKNGQVRSCGCLVKELKGPKPNPDREDAVLRKRYGELKRRINKKGGDLSFEEFKKIERQKCFYCGGTSTILDKLSGKKFELVGIDRFNYAKGYTLDNVCGCCSTCNFLKNKLNKSEFLNKVNAVYLNTIGEGDCTHKYTMFHNSKTLDKVVEDRERDYKIHAEKNNLKYNLDKQFIRQEIIKPCAYCGGFYGMTIDDKNYNGLDRKNNGDYSKEECVSCCKSCNWSKGKMSRETFLKNIKKIYCNMKYKK